MTGVSFDRASDFYDATRSLPDGVQRRVIDVLSGQLTGRGRCLEIGAGTGRIALPLHERGFDMLGVDLSRRMLDRLVAKGAGRAPFPLFVGDACHLPLAPGCVDSVIACHVLHLIPDWPRAVEEALRVLRPGGVLLVDMGGPSDTPWAQDAARIMDEYGVERRRPGLTDIDDLAAHARRHGTALRPLDPVRFRVLRSLGDDLDEWQGQIHAWTWPYRADQLAAACAAIRSWARSSGRSVDEAEPIEMAVKWWAYDAPA